MEVYKALSVIIVCFVYASAVAGDNATTATPFIVTVTPSPTSTVSTNAPTTNATTATAVTTNAPPTTAAPPSTPKNYTFFLRNSDGSACIVANMGTRFLFNTSGQQTIDLQVDKDVSNVSGTCESNSVQTMIINFTHENKNWSLSLSFVNVSGSFSLDSVFVKYYVDNEGQSLANTSQLNVKAQLEHSYLCESGINVTNFQPNKLISVFFSNMQVEAFRKPGVLDKFSAASSCEADNSVVNQLVPIIVGAALAGLVIIVLIAYLIGRARNRRAGYESV